MLSGRKKMEKATVWHANIQMIQKVWQYAIMK